MKKILSLFLSCLSFLVLFFAPPVKAVGLSKEVQVDADRMPNVLINKVSVFRCTTVPRRSTVLATLRLHLQSTEDIVDLTGEGVYRSRIVWGKRKRVFLTGGPFVQLYGVGEARLKKSPEKTIGIPTYSDSTKFVFPRGKIDWKSQVQGYIKFQVAPRAFENAELVRRESGRTPILNNCIGYPKDKRTQEEDERVPKWRMPPFFIGSPSQCEGGDDCIKYCTQSAYCGDWASCSSRSVALTTDGTLIDSGWSIGYVG